MGRDVVVSFYGPSIRTHHWIRLYESLAANTVSFEVILVGNRIPTFTLPDNFHFIFSEVKPAQCAEIACRYATGDFVMNISDDIVFSEHAIDNMVEMYGNLDDDRIMITGKFVRYGKEFPEEQARFWSGHPNSPMMPVGGLMKKETCRKLGGIDRRFVALFWDLDIAMRLYGIGGAVLRCENAWVEEIMPLEVSEKKDSALGKMIRKIDNKARQWARRQQPRNASLHAEYGRAYDRPLLDSLWERKTLPPNSDLSDSVHCYQKARGYLSRNRLTPVWPFQDKHILTVSQGPKGRWK